MIEIYGSEGCGKTALSLFFAKTIQQNGGKVLWIDAEFAFSDTQARGIGVKIEDLIMVRPETGEGALDVLDKVISTNEIDLVVVDSVAALVPSQELADDIGAIKMAPQARMMSKALRILAGKLSRTKTVAIFINQLREKIGMFVGNPNTTPGGKALKFFSY
jgi:recombination protein RecA